MQKKLKVILPLLLLIYIAIETILKSYNIELCSSTGCKMAGSLLKFNSLYLNYLGMFGAAILVLLSFFKAKSADILYTSVTVAMVIFESILIASQINLNPEVCKFCLGVYSFLLLILLNANYKIFLGLIPAILAVFIAFNILAIPKNKSLVTKDGLYLIASPTCPHCKRAKAFLKEQNISYKVVKSSDINAFYLAKNLGIKQIPIAIKKEGDSFNIVVGDKEIEKFFSKKDENKVAPAVQDENYGLDSQSKLNIYKSNKEGCELSLTATAADCEANESK